MRLFTPVFAALIASSSCASAAIVTFDIHGVSPSPWSGSPIGTRTIESGPRLNLQSRTVTQIETGAWGEKTLKKYLVTSYDVFSTSRDYYSILGSATFEIISGTIKLDVSAQGRLANPIPKFDFNVSAPVAQENPELKTLFGWGKYPATLSAMQLTSSPFLDRNAEVPLLEGSEGANFMYQGSGFQNALVRSFTILGPEYDAGVRHIEDAQLISILPMPVPEPSSWLLMLSGIAVLGFAVGCSKRKKEHTSRQNTTL